MRSTAILMDGGFSIIAPTDSIYDHLLSTHNLARLPDTGNAL